jgi:Predicted ATPase of the ABC class
VPCTCDQRCDDPKPSTVCFRDGFQPIKTRVKAIQRIMGRGEYYRNKYGSGGRGRGRGGRVPLPDDDRNQHSDRAESSTITFVGQATAPESTWQQLGQTLHAIDNRNYTSYHQLERVWVYTHTSLSFKLEFDYIQGDPYASPSRVHLIVASSSAAFPHEVYTSKIRNIALCNYLTRQFSRAASEAGADAKTGK